MAVNDITGDNLISRTLTPEGEKAFDRIFGVKKKTNGGWTPPPLNTDKLVWTENQDPDSWNEKRVDVVGQNGNEGLHYDTSSNITK